MMRTEAKATRRASRSPSSRSYLGYGLILGFMSVLLYFMVSTGSSTYSPNAYVGKAPMNRVDKIPVKSERNPPVTEDGKGEMEDSSMDEVAEVPMKPLTATRQEDANREMEDFSMDGVAVPTKPSTTTWQGKEEATLELTPFKFGGDRTKLGIKHTEKQGKMEHDRPETNPIEEELGKERNSKNWKEKHVQKKQDTVEFIEFGGGTDDFNHAADAKPICDTSFGKYDICDFAGDARTHGGADASVMLVSPRDPRKEWKIKPYSRKYLDGLKEVTVKSLNNPQDAPQCTTRLTIPAMVIELGGLTGNYWHDFTDVLIPLFIGARKFNGEVQFLVVNLLSFWVEKYRRIFNRLSRYEIIDFDKDDAVRCYPHIIVGYGSRKEFTIDPSQDSSDYTMVDFTKFLREAYSLGRDHPVKLSDSPGKRPRMMILERTNSRKFMNLHELVAAVEAAGFETMVIGRADNVGYEDFAKIVNSFDVMLGVHGAGLTNCVFLPTGAVLVQIVPYGRVEHIARTDFGQPARDMQLRYVDYGIAAEESSLMQVFGKDHPMIKDPIAIHQSGWGNVAEWYLGKQDVRIDIERFRPVLRQALEYLK